MILLLSSIGLGVIRSFILIAKTKSFGANDLLATVELAIVVTDSCLNRKINSNVNVKNNFRCIYRLLAV
jgi:hypothetical protein